MNPSMLPAFQDVTWSFKALLIAFTANDCAFENAKDPMKHRKIKVFFIL
jgi:hypothetical protein